jgi:two-component system, chemotaxis family, protein-glutamate methylesterase/glutaminase
MFQKIRVLVVDDSAFMRKVISDMISSQPDMEVINTARDGEDAISKIASLKPDVITLDVEMPKKNGLEVLKAVKNDVSCGAIMLSSLTSSGSSITMEALHFGAFDFIQKPSGSISLDIAKVKDELLEKIRCAKASGNKPVNNNIRIESVRTRMTKHNQGKIDALLLGASTGGPRVLYDVITKLPGDLNLPVFVVQHMPAGFTKAFAERMDKNSKLTVVEAKDGDIIMPNRVYIAPGGYHMLVDGKKIKLDLSPSLHGVRPAVDKLFITAAELYKGNLVACIFTGMGKDGAEGVRAVKSKGGYVIAQDEATSIVYGMPKAAYETGCVDVVMPDYNIVEEIIRVIKRM